jgi:hypothetical protein
VKMRDVVASTGDDRGRGLPSFPLLARTGHQGSILLLHLWQRKVSLRVAPKQVWENNDMEALDKEQLTLVLDFQKAVVPSNAKSCYDSC